MPGTPMRELVGLSWRQTDQITRGTISHVRLSCVQQTDIEKSILPNQSGQINLSKSIFPNQSCQINLAKSNLASSTQVPANLARLTNVGLHGSFSTLVVHTHQVPLATHQVPLAKSEK